MPLPFRWSTPHSRELISKHRQKESIAEFRQSCQQVRQLPRALLKSNQSWNSFFSRIHSRYTQYHHSQPGCWPLNELSKISGHFACTRIKRVPAAENEFAVWGCHKTTDGISVWHYKPKTFAKRALPNFGHTKETFIVDTLLGKHKNIDAVC